MNRPEMVFSALATGFGLMALAGVALALLGRRQERKYRDSLKQR